MTERTLLSGAPNLAGRFGSFRPVQYLGSKVRLLEAIGSIVSEADPARGPAVDLFSGSGVVSRHLAADREVVAVDIQEYARVLAASLLHPDVPDDETLTRAAASAARTLLDSAFGALVDFELRSINEAATGQPDALCQILEHGSLFVHAAGEGPAAGRLRDLLDAASATAPPTIARHYGGVYFSYEQALQLDCLLHEIRQLAPARCDTALAAALGAASECVTSVGSHFAQPLRPRDAQGRIKVRIVEAAARRRKRDPLQSFARRLACYSELPTSRHNGLALRADYRSFMAEHEGPVGVVYADPPYTRDHYSRFYHVLETMARGDEPQMSSVTVGGVTSLSRGLYRRDRHQSPFCIRRQASDAFDSLFAGARALSAPLVLSYSPYETGTIARPEPRLLTVAEIVALAREHYSDVRVRSAGAVRHSKFNLAAVNGDALDEAESFLICTP